MVFELSIVRCHVATRVRGEGRDHGGLGLRSRGEGTLTMVLFLSFYSTRREDRLQKGATKYPLSINGDISLDFGEGEIDGP